MTNLPKITVAGKITDIQSDDECVVEIFIDGKIWIRESHSYQFDSLKIGDEVKITCEFEDYYLDDQVRATYILYAVEEYDGNKCL
jgi:ribosomal protein S1